MVCGRLLSKTMCLVVAEAAVLWKQHRSSTRLIGGGGEQVVMTRVVVGVVQGSSCWKAVVDDRHHPCRWWT